MASEDFDRFIKKQSRESHIPDWEKQKEEWLERLRYLYLQIEEYLSDYTEEGLVNIRRRSMSLKEDKLGQYDVDQMFIHIGRQMVELTPIGTLLIGSAGRVDMRGITGTVRIALIPREVERPKVTVTIRTLKEVISEADAPAPDPDWVWKIVTNRPNMHYLMLDKDTFRSALMEVADA